MWTYTMQNPTYMFLWEIFEKHITSISYLNVHGVYKNKKSNGDDQIWRLCDNKWGIRLPPITINMPPLPFEQFHTLLYQYPGLFVTTMFTPPTTSTVPEH
jgi:hypothetical protein